MTEKQCGCQTQGLAILPVRYTVVPTYLKLTSPTWAKLLKVTSVPLDSDYQYHIRAMRNGFLYIYLPNEIGDDKWQTYTIDHDGNLYKQNSPNDAQTADELTENGGYQCPNLKNNETHNKFITISCPQEQQEIYIAFSEIPLHEETLKKLEEDPQKRMQKISTEQWKGQQQKSLDSATTATKQTIEQILDLNPDFDQKQLPYDQNKKIVANYDPSNSEDAEKKSSVKVHYDEDLSYDRHGINKNTNQNGNQPFGYDSRILKKNTTCTEWTNQKALSATIANTMAQYSEGYSPLIIAIDDPIGIAKELNGYYNEVFAKNEQYRQEREFEFNALSSYEYALELLTYKEFADDFKNIYTEHPYFKRVMQEKKLPETKDLPVFSTLNQLSVLIQKELHGKPYSASYKKASEVNNNFEADYSITNEHYKWECNYFLHGKNYSAYKVNLRDIDDSADATTIDDIFSHKDCIEYLNLPQDKRNEKNLVSYFKIQKLLNDNFENYQKKQEQYKQDKIDKINSIKKKYDKCLDAQIVNTLNQQYKKLKQEIIAIAEKRAKQVINWLRISNFYQHMKDFDGDIWEQVFDVDPDEKIVDNQLEVEQAVADNELTGEERQKIAEKINPYGIYYSKVVDKCTSGLELTDIGKLNLNYWLKAVCASKDNIDSILVRGLSNNSEMILTDVKSMLEQMENTPDTVTLDEVITTSKVGKIAAYYKKTQGFLNAVQRYEKQLTKAKSVEKELQNSAPKELKRLTRLGIKMPGNERLLKIFLSKPILTINNLTVRACNIMFSPLNSNDYIRKINYTVCMMLNMSFFGLYKQGQQAILQAQSKVSAAVVNSQWFKDILLPKTKTLPGGVVMNLTKKMRESDLNAKKEYVRQRQNKNKIISRILDINEIGRGRRIETANTDDINNNKNMLAKGSKGFKDVRLAFIIALFETYNWLKIKQQTKGSYDDSFWSAEMIGASLSMMSATTELTYQFVKTVAGSEAIAAGRIKVMSGFLGAATGVFVACQKAMNIKDEVTKGNIGLATLNFINAILYLGNAGLGLLTSTTYHIPWLTSRLTRLFAKRVLERKLSQAVLARAISMYTTRILATRVMLLGIGFWVGILILLIEGLIWFLSDNDLESWIKCSALGTKNTYQNIEEQKKEFKSVLKTMFGIDESTVKINKQNHHEEKLETKTQSNKQTDNDFNEFDALMLITNDLERRHKEKLEYLQKTIADGYRRYKIEDYQFLLNFR
jgi:hypothetical protein